MAKSLEDVLLVVAHVKNKKCEGTIYMMSERMAWMPSGKDSFTVSHGYADIKAQKISPDTKDKVQLQIVLQNSGANTFHFANPEGRDSQVADREGIKELLQQLLPQFRRKVNSELEEKNRILQEDPVMFQLYKDLVVSQVLTADEFWANRINKLKATTATDCGTRQEVGVSAAFLADIKPQTDGCNRLRYNLTADIIESIFRTYPTVQQKHMEYVPDKLKEEEFWTAFFQSHYFHRDRTTFTSKDLFADCAKKDDITIQKEIEKPLCDPFLDLLSMSDNNLSEGYRSTSDDPKVSVNQANSSLIKRFNHHSIMVLKSCDKRSSCVLSEDVNQAVSRATPTSSAATPTSNGFLTIGLTDHWPCTTDKQARIKEKIDLEELEECVSGPSGPTLKLARLDPYLHGPTPVIAMQYNTSEDMIEACQTFTHDLMAWQSQLTQVLPSSSAVNVLWELSPGGALMQNCTQQQLHQMIPVELQQEVRNLYGALSELLRHFWACFPTTNKTLEDKAVRMCESLQRFEKSKLTPMADKLTSYHYTVNLANHMHAMLEAAFSKYNTWQTRRQAMKT